MILRRVLILTSAGVLTLAAAAPAFAERNAGERSGDVEIGAAMAAPVTLTQAIAAAEGKTGGRAIEADYENVDGVTAVIVHLVKDGAVTRARVDATSGEMLATVARDEEDDEEDNEE